MASVETIAISVCPSITVIVIAVVRKRRIESLDRGQVCELSAGFAHNSLCVSGCCRCLSAQHRRCRWWDRRGRGRFWGGRDHHGHNGWWLDSSGLRTAGTTG